MKTNVVLRQISDERCTLNKF